jgi:hypothetical protein
MNSWAKYCYRWLLVPGLVGVFYGLGHFLAYMFFAQEAFKRFELRFNKFLEEVL